MARKKTEDEEAEGKSAFKFIVPPEQRKGGVFFKNLTGVWLTKSTRDPEWKPWISGKNGRCMVYVEVPK